MAHELPAQAFRFLSDTGVVLAGARVDGERGPDPEPLVKLEEAPSAHSHAVFVPAPVRHVGKQRHARGRRKDLARHRPPDVPYLVVDDGPEREPRIAGQFERRPVDDCRIIAAFPGQHGGRHGLGAPLGSRAMIGRAGMMIHRASPPARRCDIFAEKTRRRAAMLRPMPHPMRRKREWT